MNAHKERLKWKQKSRRNVKKHYMLVVFLCFLASWIGVEYSASTTIFDFGGYLFESDKKSGDGYVETLDEELEDIIVNISKGKVDKVVKRIVKRSKREDNDFNFHGLEIGHKRGVFASISNKLSSGNILSFLYSEINSIVSMSKKSTLLFVFAAGVLILLIWVFVKNILRVILKRFFIETRIYSSVPLMRATFLMRAKTWFKVAMTMLYYNIIYALWWITIVGGVYKYFEYFAVPYIVAERSDINGIEAVRLSRTIMKGHKLELFKLELSFTGWTALNFLTLGLLGIFFVNPYKEEVRCEFYAYVRGAAKDSNAIGIEVLNDKYLFKTAPKLDITDAYDDVINLVQENKEIKHTYYSGVKGFFASWFAIVPRYSKTEDEYRKSKANELEISHYKAVLKGEEYPTRLAPYYYKNTQYKVQKYYYLRHYSVVTIILMFFILSFIGWLWEVSIHLVEDGVFVNRGTMHGPWLPIYGFGGILVLVFLNKLRNRPRIQFFATMVVAGIIEYFASWALETFHNGMKWWDYTNYFLNLNGRICAEGLLVFGIGGVCVVYFIAPILDNKLRKIPYKIQVVIAVALVLLFIADMIWSHYVPNSGKGITDYALNMTQMLS